jgi:hypothetical protein
MSTAQVIGLPPKPDTEAALEFLRLWYGDRSRIVIAMDDETGITARKDFDPSNDAALRAWIDQRQGSYNLYYVANVAGPGRTTPTKREMLAGRTLHIDADLKDMGSDPNEVLERLRAFDPPPSIIVFSGGGYQVLWPFDQSLLEHKNLGWQQRVEHVNKVIAEHVGAAPGCQNCNRLLRLPGTINVLNPTKRAAGRVPATAYIVEANWTRFWSFAKDPLPRLPVVAPKSVTAKTPLSAEVQRAIKTGDASKYGGDRSALVWMVACSCVRAGLSDDEIATILLNRDNEISKHIYDQHTPQKYARRQAQNARKEVETANKAAADQIVALNKDYAVIANAGKVAILREYEDEDGLPAFSLWSAENFRLWTLNLPPIKGDKGLIPAAGFWLHHPDRRQYSGIGFMPEHPVEGWYNLFNGLAVEPAPGNCDLFLAHLRDNVAQGDGALYHWVLGWLADIVQRPGRKVGTSLVLKGKMGTGKTIVGKTMSRLLGHHYVRANRPRYITGQFNSHLVKCLLLHADEGFWAGDKAAEGVLKDLITGDVHLIEFKTFEPVPVRNYIRLLVTGNPDWLVPAGMEEHRFATLMVGEAHMQDRAYFAAIEKQLENGGYAALLRYLLDFDLSSVDIGVIPVTEQLLDQKLESLDPIQRWWLSTLREGKLPGGYDAVANACPVKALYQRYLNHASMTHVRNPRSIETQFGIALRRLMPLSAARKPLLTRRRDLYRTYYDPGPNVLGEELGYVYELPSLSACRQRFDELIGHKIDWDGDLLDGVTAEQMEQFGLSESVGDVDWDKAPLTTSLGPYHLNREAGER